MALLLTYLGILLMGLLLYSRHKPAGVTHPLYLKYIWFAVISVGMFSALNYLPYLAFFIHLVIALAAGVELLRAQKKIGAAWWIIVLSLIVVTGFVLYVPYGVFGLSGLFLCVLSFDAFSQFTGQLIGKVPLWKKLSPGKTVEGSLGGLLVCLFSAWFIYGSIWLGAVIAVTSLSGDLLASAIKRRARLKDFGQALPGQGGVLDRFDSYIFTCFVFYIFFLCQKSL